VQGASREQEQKVSGRQKGKRKGKREGFPLQFLKQVCTITFPISSAKFLFFQLQDGATNARSDDVSRIMNVVAIWINQQHSEEPQLSTTNRRDRGIHHPITGMLLCSIRYDWNNAEYVSIHSKCLTLMLRVVEFEASFVLLTQTSTILLISAYGPCIVASKVQWRTLRKVFCKVSFAKKVSHNM